MAPLVCPTFINFPGIDSAWLSTFVIENWCYFGVDPIAHFVAAFARVTASGEAVTGPSDLKTTTPGPESGRRGTHQNMELGEGSVSQHLCFFKICLYTCAV